MNESESKTSVVASCVFRQHPCRRMTSQDFREDPTYPKNSTPTATKHKNVRSKSVSYADDVVPKKQLTRTLSEPRPTVCLPNGTCGGTEMSSARRKSIDTIGLHYYPEGGWGYVVCFGAFVINFVVYGFIGSCGCFYIFMIQRFGNQYHMQACKYIFLLYSKTLLS